ncbi:MAG: hypothetical protein CMI61_06385 [Parvibaculum sp.]|nr:hypothetical protein [Parvibaculum sp.]HCX67776.1 hypothetical protein [Rhodobiaceae bacterium]
MGEERRAAGIGASAPLFFIPLDNVPLWFFRLRDLSGCLGIGPFGMALTERRRVHRLAEKV